MVSKTDWAGHSMESKIDWAGHSMESKTDWAGHSMESKTDWAGHSMESTYGPGPPFSKHPFLTLNQAVLCVHRWRRSSASLWSFATSMTHGSWMWPMSSSCRRTNTRRLLASMIPSSKRTMTRYLAQYSSHCISQLAENKQKNLLPGGSFLSHDENTSVIAILLHLSCHCCFAFAHNVIQCELKSDVQKFVHA